MWNFDAVEFYLVVKRLYKEYGIDYYTGEAKLIDKTKDAYLFDTWLGVLTISKKTKIQI